MQPATEMTAEKWPLWRKWLFQFFFIYLLLQIIPWWFNTIPYNDSVTQYYYNAEDWLVQLLNKHWYHIKDTLVYPNGSGDTSYGWAEQWTFLCLAFAGNLLWLALDRKRNHYQQLNYWLCLATRYYVALVCFSYGFDKILLMQMPFPNQSQLATPLGDFLPMRLSWMFIGYSAPYQFFSGLMECIAGVLLLYRRTITLGVMVATGVFVNVMMLNLSYDIPVKIFSMNMVLICLFLLANEGNRIACFFIMNQPASTCSLYHFTYAGKKMLIGRWILKIAFFAAIAMLFYNTYQYKTENEKANAKSFISGIYNVEVYAVNKDTIPAIITDTARWQDMIFETSGDGSIKTTDTSFRQRYHRAYFTFTTDTIKHTVQLKKFSNDSLPVMTFWYNLPNSSTINLWGKKNNDSLYVKLVKSDRHFQLAERQFHWLSEANR